MNIIDKLNEMRKINNSIKVGDTVKVVGMIEGYKPNIRCIVGEEYIVEYVTDKRTLRYCKHKDDKNYYCCRTNVDNCISVITNDKGYTAPSCYFQFKKVKER